MISMLKFVIDHPYTSVKFQSIINFQSLILEVIYSGELKDKFKFL